MKHTLRFLSLLTLGVALTARAQVSIPPSNLSTASSAVWATKVTDETGTGLMVFNTSPALVTPTIGGNLVSGVATVTQAQNVQTPSTSLVPSVSSMQAAIAPLRNALAPQQGLVFDGSSVWASTAGVPAFGIAGSFTWDFVVKHTAAFTSYSALCGGQTNSFGLYIDSAGKLTTTKVGVSGGTVSTGALVVGKTAHVTFVSNAGAGTYYIDGVAAGTSNDAAVDYSVATTLIGNSVGGTSPFTGELRLVGLYNRALSAAEVLSLYESGAPAAADYPATPAGVAVNTGTFVTTILPYTTFGSASTTGFAATSNGASSQYAKSNSFAVKLGQRVRVIYTLVLNSGTAPSASVDDFGVSTISNVAVLSAGVGNIAEFVVTSTNAAAVLTLSNNSTATDYALSDVTIVPEGLLCAPESNAPGNGYWWADVSGNHADIIRPASGVDWALPTVTGSNAITVALTWAGTHEAKSLLGQVALPSNAQITSITTEATAGSSGSGLTVGSVTTPNLFVAANSYTTAKKSHTLAGVFPAGTATNDLNVVIDPDTSNYTGTINVTVNYILTR